jgi:hypothetical protein
MTNALATSNGNVKPAEPRRDYVAAGPAFWYAGAVRALPFGIDDLSQDVGDDVYTLMLHDATVSASVNALRAGILEDGVTLVPAVTKEQADGFAQSAELVTFCQSVLDDLDIALDDVLWDMCRAIALGNRVAEVVYRLDAGRLVTSSVKVKPRTATAFVVDAFMNVLGLAAVIPGQAWSVPVGTYLTNLSDTNVLPRNKFAVLTHRPHDNDPRGTSALRPAYNPWWLKRTSWPEYLKYLVQFATPSVVGYTAENATPGPDGKEPTVALSEALVQWRNATALALRYGAKIDVIFSQGEGKAFLNAFQLFDRQIIHAVLNQTLATMEGEHQSRAASETHQDVMDTLIRQGKKAVQRMIHRDILHPLIRYNYGDKAVALCPVVTLGETESQDVASLWTAAGTVGYTIDPSQLPELDKFLNMPPRVIVSQPKETPPPQEPPPAQQQDAARQQTQQNGGTPP